MITLIFTHANIITIHENNPTSRHSKPKGSLKLPYVNTLSGEKAIRYAFAKNWNDTLKELFRTNTVTGKVEMFTDFWLKDMNSFEVKSILKFFSKLLN